MKTLLASFDDLNRAADAMAALLDHGVKREALELMANSSFTEEIAEAKAEKATDGITTTTAADAAEGAKKGGLAGLLAGALGGVASLTIPGYGIVIGSGALATALGAAAGTGVAGVAAGGMTGFLMDQGADQQVSKDIEQALENGGGLLSAEVSHQASDGVRKVLEKYQADFVVEVRERTVRR